MFVLNSVGLAPTRLPTMSVVSYFNFVVKCSHGHHVTELM